MDEASASEQAPHSFRGQIHAFVPWYIIVPPLKSPIIERNSRESGSYFSCCGLSGCGPGPSGGDALISEKKVSANVAEWTIRDVEHWLTACGLGEVKNAFRHHQVGESLPDATSMSNGQKRFPSSRPCSAWQLHISLPLFPRHLQYQLQSDALTWRLAGRRQHSFGA